MTESIFEGIGVAKVTSGSGGRLFSIDGVGGDGSAFGILQGFEIAEKVSASTKKTLRNAPIMFPMGDDFTEISASFITPMRMLCGNVGSWSNAVRMYTDNRVRPGAISTVMVNINNYSYRCFIMSMHLSGTMMGSLPIVTVSLRMIGQRTGVSS